MTEAYRVPKHRVAVTVGLTGVEPLGVDLFLAPSTRSGQPERPSDLLRGDEAFFPVAHVDGGLSFVQRDAVAYLTVPVEAEHTGDTLDPEDLAADLTIQARITIVLQGDFQLTGTVYYLLPDGKRRVLDFLNTPEPFLALYDEEVVHIINKVYVLRVVPE